MHFLKLFLIVSFSALLAQNAWAQKTVLDNHFDVVEKLSTIQSKSRQLVLEMQKKFAGSPDLDSAKLLYFDLKASSDGVISRYKAMIDNPKMAKKEGENITRHMNKVIENLNTLAVFNVEHGRQNMGLVGLVVVSTITEIGKGVYNEIKNLQQDKRDALKAEVDSYRLPDFDEVH